MQENGTIYEQPLNERIRAFLRLEYLLNRAAYRLNGDQDWDSRASIDAIIDILDILGRTDLKKEIFKELDRSANTLEGLRSNPEVDPVRVDNIIDEISRFRTTLHNSDTPPGYSLRQNELLAYVRQRSNIPAGSCGFDIPAMQHWLSRPAAEREQQLQAWLGEFDLIRGAITLCLNLTREGASSSTELAERGFYQRTLEPSAICRMVRVIVPADAPWFPEISGGRHRFSIRFMTHENCAARPAQTSDDVQFQLHCCML